MIKPIFTEKSMLEAKRGKYTFEVSGDFTKSKIKSEVKSVFNVDVQSVRTINIKGGTKRNFRGRTVSVKGYKKAVVTLKKGQKLDIFEEKKK